MKNKRNVWVIPTDKPSRIYLIKSTNKLGITSSDPFYMENFGSGTQNQHIYITNNEEIKEGDWFYDLDTKYVKIKQSWENSHLDFNGKKIILTTDQDLIKDGVQEIDDEFFEWVINNPSCDEVDVKNPLIANVSDFGYKTIIPQEEPKQECCQDVSGFYLGTTCSKCNTPFRSVIQEPKQETLEEFAFEKYPRSMSEKDSELRNIFSEGLELGAKWMEERMYSEEDIINALHSVELKDNKDYSKIYNGMKEWFNQFKKK
jgi:hypothetical protein